MAYKIAVRRTSTYLPVYGLWNGDADTALGQQRIQDQKPYEARERFKFLRQR